MNEQQQERQSKGGVVAPPTTRDLLSRSDSELGALLVGMMSAGGPTSENFAALGRLVKAGVQHINERLPFSEGDDALAAMLKRRGR